MRALVSSKPEYQDILILRVDWDKFRDDRITEELNVSRRSTLVMFNNNGEEVARVVAQTDSASIEALFQAVM